jgi:hypothetical protein
VDISPLETENPEPSEPASTLPQGRDLPVKGAKVQATKQVRKRRDQSSKNQGLARAAEEVGVGIPWLVLLTPSHLCILVHDLTI